MSKKHFTIYFLLFTYAIVLGHNAIPHGHFDDLYYAEHPRNPHSDNKSDDKHNHPFSHSVTLHVAIEKQTVITNHFTKNAVKKTTSNYFNCIRVTFQPLIYSASSSINFTCYNQQLIKGCSTSISSRAPPNSMS